MFLLGATLLSGAFEVVTPWTALGIGLGMNLNVVKDAAEFGRETVTFSSAMMMTFITPFLSTTFEAVLFSAAIPLRTGCFPFFAIHEAMGVINTH